jgi:hypothetical protein
MKRFFTLAALISLTGTAMAQDAMKVVKSDALVWKEHPVFKGALIAALIGDPSRAEVIVQRVKIPPNFKIPPHTHSYSECHHCPQWPLRQCHGSRERRGAGAGLGVRTGDRACPSYLDGKRGSARAG